MHLDRLILGGAVSAAPSRHRSALLIAADAAALVAVLAVLFTTAAIFEPTAEANPVRSEAVWKPSLSQTEVSDDR